MDEILIILENVLVLWKIIYFMTTMKNETLHMECGIERGLG